jgi:hypothetical protein
MMPACPPRRQPEGADTLKVPGESGQRSAPAAAEGETVAQVAV